MIRFDTFFKVGTKDEKSPEGKMPFDYQCRLACGERKVEEDTSKWLSRGTNCQTTLVSVPTGLGKTEAVVFSWLWNRLLSADGKFNERWPTRLVYCLPMRTLVEQTEDRIKTLLKNLYEGAQQIGLGENAVRELEWMKQISPVVLRGGEEIEDYQKQWDIYPERPCIIIGTQDMLLSRALNRGYGMSVYRWPVHFSLLNVDALWVFDETQLMGVSLETSAQLDAFRKRFGDATINCKSWWMSATLNEKRLDTIDQRQFGTLRHVIKLSTADYADQIVAARVHARKVISKCQIILQPKDNKYADQIAKFALGKHKSGSLTLIVVNRVDRAQGIFKALEKMAGGINVSLIHSRFRPVDRQNVEEVLKEDGNRIVVATQAVEAGVDCSARVLITELAPWASLVQRFGRCNRRGEFNDAEIYWIDFANENGEAEFYLPYNEQEIRAAREKINDLKNGGISEIGKIEYNEPEEPRFVIRGKDMIELFDTTPDISGRYIDVTRFIRERKDAEVQVFWRENADEITKTQDGDSGKNIKPLPIELCRVPLAQFRNFINKTVKKGNQVSVYYWNYLDDKWDKATEETIYPGCIYLLDSNSGGYDEKLGWTGEYTTPVKPIAIPEIKNGSKPDSNDADFGCTSTKWIELSEHLLETQQVSKEIVAEIQKILPGFLKQDEAQAIEDAALFHDLGKAHTVFQNAIKNNKEVPNKSALYAKSPGGVLKYERSYFRHELASAIAWLMWKDDGSKTVNLSAYLIAAHHGKVRLSIRSMPDEKPPHGETRIARGIQDGDLIPSLTINGIKTPEINLDLTYMEIGFDEKRGESWISRMTRLRDEIGIFKLAYLEALVRAADARASMNVKNVSDNKF